MLVTSLPPPADGILMELPSTVAHVGSTSLGSGTLFVAESRLSWSGDEGRNLSLEYPHIVLHAVSRDTSNFPQPCLYLMVDTIIPLPGVCSVDAVSRLNGANGDGDGGGEDGSSSDEAAVSSNDSMTEVRFVPDDEAALDALFQSMTQCQSLHPDPNHSYSEDGDVEESDGNEAEEDGRRVVGLPSSNGDLEDEAMETGQFEDADN